MIWAVKVSVLRGQTVRLRAAYSIAQLILLEELCNFSTGFSVLILYSRRMNAVKIAAFRYIKELEQFSQPICRTQGINHLGFRHIFLDVLD